MWVSLFFPPILHRSSLPLTPYLYKISFSSLQSQTSSSWENFPFITHQQKQKPSLSIFNSYIFNQKSFFLLWPISSMACLEMSKEVSGKSSSIASYQLPSPSLITVKDWCTSRTSFFFCLFLEKQGKENRKYNSWCMQNHATRIFVENILMVNYDIHAGKVQRESRRVHSWWNSWLAWSSCY